MPRAPPAVPRPIRPYPTGERHRRSLTATDRHFLDAPMPACLSRYESAARPLPGCPLSTSSLFSDAPGPCACMRRPERDPTATATASDAERSLAVSQTQELGRSACHLSCRTWRQRAAATHRACHCQVPCLVQSGSHNPSNVFRPHAKCRGWFSQPRTLASSAGSRSRMPAGRPFAFSSESWRRALRTCSLVAL